MGTLRQTLNRRLFLRHLRNSPLYAWALSGHVGSNPALPDSAPGIAFAATPAEAKIISDPAQALNVFDFMSAAEQKMSVPHWTYLMTGVDDNRTRDANSQGYGLFQIRPRRFIDVEGIDTSVEIFGQRLPTPIMLSPIGSLRAFHDEGELAAARGAGARGNQMLLSTFASHHVDEVAKAYQKPLWFQLYPTTEWDVTRALLERAEDAGCPVLAITADTPVLSNKESLYRVANKERPECLACHSPEAKTSISRRSMFQGIDLTHVRSFLRGITWDLVDRIRQTTRMKIVIKGVMTAEDAELCVRNGVDGIIVSNHGGRQLESLLSTIEVLPEVVQAVNGKIPVLIDGGIRRGTDVFKALAIGADAVCIGRPYVWGLGAFGQPGVERILELLQAELVRAMQLAGTVSLDRITPAHVRRRPV
jgi:isopentenyl diphosphate isomerase/L-lactate dehydrogenase-like FMN-dependent dehydrogenase